MLVVVWKSCVSNPLLPTSTAVSFENVSQVSPGYRKQKNYKKIFTVISIPLKIWLPSKINNRNNNNTSRLTKRKLFLYLKKKN